MEDQVQAPEAVELSQAQKQEIQALAAQAGVELVGEAVPVEVEDEEDNGNEAIHAEEVSADDYSAEESA